MTTMPGDEGIPTWSMTFPVSPRGDNALGTPLPAQPPLLRPFLGR